MCRVKTKEAMNATLTTVSGVDGANSADLIFNDAQPFDGSISSEEGAKFFERRSEKSKENAGDSKCLVNVLFFVHKICIQNEQTLNRSRMELKRKVN